MLTKHKQQVREAEGRRLQARARLTSANHRWDYQKRRFFRNPVNLLLPFTAGALLASRGSATRQVLDWSRIIEKTGKLLIAAYPLIRPRLKKMQSPGDTDAPEV